MKFNLEVMKSILMYIESNISFQGNDINDPTAWNMMYDISINNFVESHKIYQINEIRYCLWILRTIGYIDFSKDTITNVTPQGYKFILNTLHNINCMY